MVKEHTALPLITGIRELWANGELTVRMRMPLPITPVESGNTCQMNYAQADRFFRRLGNMSGVGDDMLRFIGIQPPAVGGNVEGGDSWTLEAKAHPYPDRWGNASPFGGRLQEQEVAAGGELFRGRGCLVQAVRFGWDVSADHTIGDRAVHEVVNAFEEGLKTQLIKRPNEHLTINHTPMANEADNEKMAKLGIGVSIGEGMITKSTAWKLCFGSVLLLGLFSRVAAAQFEDTEDEKPDPEAKKFTRVMLRNTDATPGQAIVVPIYFTPAEEVAVGHLKITITFVSVNMKFLKMERGIAAEISDIDLKTSVKEGKNDKGVETSTLTIETTNSSSEPPKEGIHDGLLAYMTLKLSDTARPAVIKLNTVAEAKELGSNKPVKNLQTAEAQVEVFAPGTQPAVACFFFSH